MKYRSAVSIFITILCFSLQAANGEDLGPMIQHIGGSAAQGYLQPFVTATGAGLNGGWYNSSQPYMLFQKLPLGISIGMVNLPFVRVSESMKTFDYSGPIPFKTMLNEGIYAGITDTIDFRIHRFATAQDSLTLAMKSDVMLETGNTRLDTLQLDSIIQILVRNQPTVFGSTINGTDTLSRLLSGTKSLETIRIYNAIRKAYSKKSGTVADTISYSTLIPLPFAGLGKYMYLGNIIPSIPNVSVQFGISKIPVIDNVTIGFRFLPRIEMESMGSVSQLGWQIQYEWLHFIPYMRENYKNFHASARYAQNNLVIHTGPARIAQENWIASLNGSFDQHKGVAGGGLFAGVSYEHSTLTLDMEPDSVNGIAGFSGLKIKGNNTYRFTIGPRISILCFEIWATYNFGSVTSYELAGTIFCANGHGF